jgi:hypothetical protein
LEENEGLLLTATDSFDKEIYTWTWKLKSNDEVLNQFSKSLVKEFPVTIAENDSLFILKSDEKEFAIGKKDGLLKSVIVDKKGKKMTFKNGPVFMNEKMELTSIKSFFEDDNMEIEASYKNGNKIIWKLNHNGILELNYEYSLSGDYQFAGVSFDYPENYVIHAKWLGKGPYHVWKNRTQGQTYNVWQNLKTQQEPDNRLGSILNLKAILMMFRGCSWIQQKEKSQSEPKKKKCS